MYKRILVAIDESDTSQLALQEAIKLSEENKAKLRILHVADEQFVDYSGMGVDYKTYEASIKKSGQQLLNTRVKAALNAEIDVDTQLIELIAV